MLVVLTGAAALTLLLMAWIGLPRALLAGLFAACIGLAAVVLARRDDAHRLRASLGRTDTAALHADPWAALDARLRDLGERVSELEARRRESEAVLGSLQDGVIALDAAQRVLAMNRAAGRMLGASGAFERGRLLQEIARQPSLNAFVLDAIRQSHGASEEFELSGPEPRRVRAVGSSLVVGDAEERGLLIVLTDVTRLRRLETMRSEFAANAAHELRTPITNIMGYVETLQETGWEDGALAKDCLDTISRHAGRLGAIIDDMLALTRLESSDGRQGIDAYPARIGDVIDSAISEFADEAGRKGVRIHVAGDSELRAVVNPALARQAVGNLLSNAIRYSSSGTTVTITARSDLADSDARLVQIEVADEGPGIAPEHLPRIFERFYRIDKARSRQLGGTGLGLAIVKHIALVHGGGVDVQSEVGRGTSFRLTLPGD